MNIPLMNINGNLTNVEIIITLDGTLVGGVEKRTPSDEKQKAAITMDVAKIRGLMMPIPISNPKASGTIEMATPKTKDAKTSPRRIAESETGAETNLSSVLMLPSQGVITGDTEVVVKKRVMLSKLDIRNSMGMFLPTEKARKRNSGNKMPKMRTGPLR
jgi:hypothetical protein